MLFIILLIFEEYRSNLRNELCTSIHQYFSYIENCFRQKGNREDEHKFIINEETENVVVMLEISDK